MNYLMNYLLFALFTLSSVLAEAAPFYLKESLQYAQTGDYVVAKQDKNLTLFHIIEKKTKTLLIEEITIPEKSLGQGINWKKWIQESAPKHTSWVRYEIDLQTGRLIQSSTLTHEGVWAASSLENSLFTQLLNIPFTPLPNHLRKRRGSISAHNPNPYWQPKMTYEGKTIEGEALLPWHARWPEDGSELSGKMAIIYTADKNSKYPNYFPYWIEVKGSVTRGCLSLFDSGRL